MTALIEPRIILPIFEHYPRRSILHLSLRIDPGETRPPPWRP